MIPRRFLCAFVSLCLCAVAAAASGQLSPPNSAGISMGHLHYYVKDVEANVKFWVTLGGRASKSGTADVVRFPDVLVFVSRGESTGGTEGSVINHVAFRVQSLAKIEAAGLKVEHNKEFPGVASVFSPEGERIELFDDNLATNLMFTADNGVDDPVSRRHNQKIRVPIISHHIHLYVPDGAVLEAKRWYAEMFGGVAGKRWRYDAVDLPGINFNFSSAPRALAPTRGRMLDHIGFEVRNPGAFSEKLKSKGVKVDSGVGTVFITDPWGTRIELTDSQ